MNRQDVLTTIKNGFRWWKQGLLAWLPEPLVQKMFSQPSIQCGIEGDIVTLCLVNKQGLELDKFCFNLSCQQSEHDAAVTWVNQYKSYKFLLIIPEQESLIRQIQMPAKAKVNLDEMLKFEIDRQTPFTLEQVFYGYQLLGNSIEINWLPVNLAVVPKRFVNDRIAKLRAFSVSINTLLLSKPVSPRIRIPLLEPMKEPCFFIGKNIALLIFALLLALMLLYKPIWYYQKKTEVMQPTITEVKKRAQDVNKLKKQNEKLTKQALLLTNISGNYHSKLALLNELAELLPTHTWLRGCEFEANSLTLYGQSAATENIIELLINTRYFDKVQFIEPLIYDQQSGKEVFKLEAVLKPKRSIGPDV